jgi:sigma-B regulation protein RsbU (phosphoserine phosphatase)
MSLATTPAVSSFRPLRILIVDDTFTTRTLVKEMLEREGHAVCLAATAEQGLTKILGLKPDLVLLDYMLPDLDGVDVARRIRADPYMRDVPIILLTASTLESTIEAAFAAGVDDYLPQPVARRLLLARVDAVARIYEARLAERKVSALTKDLEEARRVQQSLLPQLPVKWGKWQASGAVLPSSLVGGDMLDVMPGMDGAKVVVLVDVAGHGMAAALVAAQVSGTLRMLVQTHPLAEAMYSLGCRMSSHSNEHYACVAAIEVRGDELTLINAGLPPVCLIRNGGIRQFISANAVPLGLLPSPPEIVPTHLLSMPGDLLVMLSDGLTEPFGPSDAVTPPLSRLGLLGERARTPPQEELAERIQSLVGDIQTDDATLLLLDHTAHTER